MRKFATAATLLISLFLSVGCSSVPPEALTRSASNALISDAFIVLMEKGETTREDEQAFILANRRNWHALNFAVSEIPLPEDMQEGFEGDLLESLQKDPKIRALLKTVKDALAPEEDTTPDTPTPEGE